MGVSLSVGNSEVEAPPRHRTFPFEVLARQRQGTNQVDDKYTVSFSTKWARLGQPWIGNGFVVIFTSHTLNHPATRDMGIRQMCHFTVVWVKSVYRISRLIWVPLAILSNMCNTVNFQYGQHSSFFMQISCLNNWVWCILMFENIAIFSLQKHWNICYNISLSFSGGQWSNRPSGTRY